MAALDRVGRAAHPASIRSILYSTVSRRFSLQRLQGDQGYICSGDSDPGLHSDTVVGLWRAGLEVPSHRCCRETLGAVVYVW
jgi:hypothetical protein